MWKLNRISDGVNSNMLTEENIPSDEFIFTFLESIFRQSV